MHQPVVTWGAIRLILVLSLIFGWATRQIDFVLAYTQADAETDIYMEIPQGIELDGYPTKDYVLKLVKNLYGGRAAGRVWNQHLHKKLLALNYQQSAVEPCVYYRGNLILLFFVDDGIAACPDPDEITSAIAELAEHFDVSDEGHLTDYLGVSISKDNEGRLHLTQPHVIDQIIKDLNFQSHTKAQATPFKTDAKLHKDEEANDHAASWKYRSVIGKLNFLEKSTRPDLAYAVHNCARFMDCPKQSHSDAVHRIGRYLMGTRNQGLILNPTDKSFEIYVDADFCGLFDKERAEFDRNTALSRTGFVVKYAGCPIIWQSKLQGEVAQSTTAAEYIALSMAIREALPIIYLLKEMHERKLLPELQTPKVHCKVFEDNSGALEIAKAPKMRPRTKYLNVKYHHFRDLVDKGLISIHPISTENQQADILTKAVRHDLFFKFRKLILGW